jgi:hypothetical protein
VRSANSVRLCAWCSVAQRRRNFVPVLRDFLQEAIVQLDPVNEIEEEYWCAHALIFTLKLLSSEPADDDFSPSFPFSSLTPPRSIKDQHFNWKALRLLERNELGILFDTAGSATLKARFAYVYRSCVMIADPARLHEALHHQAGVCIARD